VQVGFEVGAALGKPVPKSGSGTRQLCLDRLETALWQKSQSVARRAKRIGSFLQENS